MCAMDEAIDIVWVCPPSFFIHFLLRRRGRFFFSLFIFRLLFFVSCLFVCVFVVRGGVICVACIIILYSRTDAIHFKRYY
mgnify:CR=1 FL=1